MKSGGAIGDLPGIYTSKWSENFKYELLGGHEWTVTVPMHVDNFFRHPVEEQVVTVMKVAAKAEDPNYLEVKDLVDKKQVQIGIVCWGDFPWAHFA